MRNFLSQTHPASSTSNLNQNASRILRGGPRTGASFGETELRLRIDQCSQLIRRPHGWADLPSSMPFVSLQSLVGEEEPKSIELKQLAAEEAIDADLSETASHKLMTDRGLFTLTGDNLLCRCPACHAPLTLRTWLGLADCWRCHASIELTSQELASVTLELPSKTLPENKTASPTTDRRKTAAMKSAQIAAPSVGSDDLPIDVSASIELSPTVDNIDIDPRELEWEVLAGGSLLPRLARRGYEMTPAWLVSLVLHLVLLLILALIILRDSSTANLPRIVLSSSISLDRELGGDVRIEPSDYELQDDLSVASMMRVGEAEARDLLEKARQDARELIEDLRPEVILPELTTIKENITNRPDHLMSFAARDPRVRAEIVTKEGGTTLTEAAVARGLRWLVSVQNKDGSWSLANYDKHSDPRNPGDVMGTALALLPLLGAGQTHEYGIYRDNVAAGLAWLIENQLENGDLRAGFREEAGMYAHGQAAIVLCEALAMTGDERFRIPAQRAIEFIENAQHAQGGWRYRPGEPGDTSVFGWQMMALQSARSTNLSLTGQDSTLRLADYFLDQVIAPAKYNDRRQLALPRGAAYAYLPGRPATAPMTAEAILCRMYLGWNRQDPRIAAAVKWLIADHLPNEKEYNVYYWYYGTQVMHHHGGQPWEIWNAKMQELLLPKQIKQGKFAGSWDTSICPWGKRGGRIYTTSLACCIFEVYYRHLPLFEQLTLD